MDIRRKSRPEIRSLDLHSVELQGWSSVPATTSGVLRKRRETETVTEKAPIAETMQPRIAVLVSPSGGEPGAVVVNHGAGTLRIPSGPKGGFQFDYVAAPSDAARMYEERVADVVDLFVDDKRSGSVVLIGGESARVREILGDSGSGADAAGVEGVLPKMLTRLVASEQAVWDVVVTIHKPEAAGMAEHHHLIAGTPPGSPRASPASSPRLRPVTVRLAKLRDVATTCSVITRQLAVIWGDAEAAVGGQLICTIRRSDAGGHAPATIQSRSARPALRFKQSTATMQSCPQLSVVVFGTVKVSFQHRVSQFASRQSHGFGCALTDAQAPNHVSFRALTRLLKLRQNREKPPDSQEAKARAYALAGKTVHVRGIPMNFSEAALQERFSEVCATSHRRSFVTLTARVCVCVGVCVGGCGFGGGGCVGGRVGEEGRGVRVCVCVSAFVVPMATL